MCVRNGRLTLQVIVYNNFRISTCTILPLPECFAFPRVREYSMHESIKQAINQSINHKYPSLTISRPPHQTAQTSRKQNIPFQQYPQACCLIPIFFLLIRHCSCVNSSSQGIRKLSRCTECVVLFLVLRFVSFKEKVKQVNSRPLVTNEG